MRQARVQVERAWAARPWWVARFWTAALVALAVSAAAGGAAAQTAQLGGGYTGIDEATGWSVRLDEKTSAGVASGYQGTFVDRDGSETAFEAFLAGEGGLEAEARFELAGRSVYLRFSPRPIGMLMTLIPINSDDQLEIASSSTFPFVRAGVALPDAPTLLAPPPTDASVAYDPLLFLISYEFWTPVEVGVGYASLEDRWKTLIRFYTQVHTDVLWKLCRAERTPPGLVEALEGQNVTCNDVIGKIARMQSGDQFSRYKADVAEVKARLVDAVKCARGQLLKRECVRVNAWTNRAAVSLDTAATVLAKY